MTTHSATTIDLLRHGQTLADDILRGRIDVPLSTAGYQQMRDTLAPYLTAASPWQQLVSSPLQRCAHFAEQLAEQQQTPLHIEHNFLEMDFGDWDGRTFAELEAEDPILFQNVWRQPQQYNPPNGETFIDFANRINRALDTLLEQYSGQHILLVCHGGVIRALLGHVMQTPLTALSRIDVPYACLSRIKVHHQPGESHWPQLIFHNPQPHKPQLKSPNL